MAKRSKTKRDARRAGRKAGGRAKTGRVRTWLEAHGPLDAPVKVSPEIAAFGLGSARPRSAYVDLEDF